MKIILIGAGVVIAFIAVLAVLYVVVTELLFGKRGTHD